MLCGYFHLVSNVLCHNKICYGTFGETLGQFYQFFYFLNRYKNTWIG